MGQSMRAASRRLASERGGAAAMRLTQRARLVIVVAAVVVLALAAGSWLVFLWHALHTPVGQYDFSSYYAAALALRSDPHADIYAASVLARSGAAGHVQVQPPLPYTYPPLLAIAFTPLTLFSFHVAARLWLLANAGLWLACTLLLANELRRWLSEPLAQTEPVAQPTLWARTLADPSLVVALAASAAICLPFAPAQQTLLTGQIDLLVLLPLALIPWLTRHRHERWVGGAVALAAMLKLTPVILLGYLALRRRWEALAAGLVTLALLALACLVVVGPGVFFAALPEALRVGGHDAALGHNEALLAPLLSALTAAAPNLASSGRAVEYAFLAALAVVIGLVLWSTNPSGRALDAEQRADAEMPGYAVALCALLLLSPAAWVHHYVWVLPAAILLLGMVAAQALTAVEPAAQRQAILLVGALAVALVLLGWALPHNWDTEPRPATSLVFGLPLRTVALELRAIGTLILLGVGVLLALGEPVSAARSRTTSSPSGQPGVGEAAAST